MHVIAADTRSEAASGRSVESDAPGTLTRVDVLWMTLGFLCCLAACFVLGHKRMFWEDEMLAWMLLRDPSFHHMVQAWTMGADGGGFTFYLLGRAWFSLFGHSVLAFRMLSATCFGLAFCTTWVAARHFYRRRIVAFSLFTCWFVGQPIVIHMAEGRFYGLLAFGTSLLVWLVLTRSNADVTGPVRTPLPLYVLTFLFHGLLTTSHLLGIAYSGMLLLAVVVLDRRSHRFRPMLYLSAALAWLLLIPERHAIQASAAVGKPWFWTTTPGLWTFLAAFVGFSAGIALLLLVLAVLFVVSAKRTGESMQQALRRGFRERCPVYTVAAAVFLVPVVFALHAYLGATSLFAERYLLPVMIATALLLMELVQLIRWDAVLPRTSSLLLTRRGQQAVATLFAVCLTLWVFHLRREALGNPNYETKLFTRIPTGLPVVCEDAWSFVDLISRRHGADAPYSYLLDWPYSVSAQAPKLEVTQYHLMQNWKKVGYFSGSIRYRDEFLHNQNVFVLLNPKTFPVDRTGRAIGNPLLQRFMLSPGYQLKLLSSGTNTLKVNYGVDQAYDVWLVCRFACPAN